MLDRLHTFHAVRGDGAQQLEVHHTLGCMELNRGDLPAARAHLEQAVALYDAAPAADAFRLSGHVPRACALSHLAHTLWLLGYPDQALQRARQAVAWAEQESAFSRALMKTSLSLVHLLRREAAAAQRVADAALALAAEQEFPHVAARATMLRGWAVSVQGDAESGLDQLRTGLAMCEAMGVGRTEYLVLFADACLRSGRPDPAHAALAEAEDGVAAGGEHYFDAEMLRLRAALTADPSDAAELLRAARRRAAGQSAGGFDLRIACQLAAWHRAHGQSAEARAVLAPLIDGLVEGRDTGDVAEARTLYSALVARRRRA